MASNLIDPFRKILDAIQVPKPAPMIDPFEEIAARQRDLDAIQNLKPVPMNNQTASLDERSKALRRLIVRGLAGGNRGHLGSAFSLVEILRAINETGWPTGGHRLILSKGHGCLALYALLADIGIIDKTELDRFCHYGAPLGGHPSHKIPGITIGTGSLGHGLAVGVGMALAMDGRNYPERVFVVMGDGECNEGSVWEAALHAAKHGLANLTVVVDCNGMQSAGATVDISGAVSGNWSDMFSALGWEWYYGNGHNLDFLRRHLKEPGALGPKVLIVDTTKGKGFPLAENNPAWHHRNSFTPEELTAMHEALR